MALPPDVLERIAATVAELADTPQVERMVIASAPDPAAESRDLQADAVVDVFRSDDAEEVGEVLEFLRGRFAEHPKARRFGVDITRPSGHVYVALWAVADIEAPD